MHRYLLIFPRKHYLKSDNVTFFGINLTLIQWHRVLNKNRWVFIFLFRTTATFAVLRVSFRIFWSVLNATINSRVNSGSINSVRCTCDHQSIKIYSTFCSSTKLWSWLAEHIVLMHSCYLRVSVITCQGKW